MSEQTKILDRIGSPEDLRRLEREEVAVVADALRAEIVEKVSRTGGHLASSLGAVELLTAIHYVFDTPNDRIVLDVGHQGYAHKMLTGRREGFERIGKDGGIGKFLRRDESEHDHFGAGHAGTSISAALGMARAFEHQGKDNVAIAMIGDGGMTAGMAFEALNHAGHLHQKNLVVVLNDNEMSISPNVGAMSSYLSRKLSAPMVRRMKGWAKEFLGSMPGDMLHWAQQGRGVAEGLLLAGAPLRGARLQVRRPHPGPPRGRAARDLRQREGDARGRRRPRPRPRAHREGLRLRARAERPASSTTASARSTSSRVSSRRRSPARRSYHEGLLADADPPREGGRAHRRHHRGDGGRHRASTASRRSSRSRFYDVGIAEQHAVTFAAGLAAEGMKPVAAIYSTFLQRAYDQVVHDVCLQNLDVTLRARSRRPRRRRRRDAPGHVRHRLPPDAAEHRS